MNRRLVIIILAIFFVSCANLSFAKDAKSKNYDNAIRVKAGKEFVITLNSNLTTGYQWQLTKAVNKEYLILVGLQYIAKKTRVVGSGGKEEWTFKAVKPGVTSVSFQYVRPWEKKVPPAKTKKFSVIIK